MNMLFHDHKGQIAIVADSSIINNKEGARGTAVGWARFHSYIRTNSDLFLFIIKHTCK